MRCTADPRGGQDTPQHTAGTPWRRHHTGLRLGLALTAATVLLVGCGAGGPGPAAGGPEGTPDSSPSSMAVSGTEIVISDFAYAVPDSVPAGTEVTVTNHDDVGHTVTADEGAFDVAVGPGETVVFTAPEAPGIYDIHCIPHQTMTAALVVS